MSDALDHENVAWRIERDGWTFDYQEQLTSKYPALTNRMVHLALNRASELGVSVETGVRNQLWLPEESQSNQSNNNPSHSTECVGSAVGDSQDCLEDSACDAPWRWLVIHVDGAVRACCYMQGGVGDWHRESIEKIWNGKIMQEVRIAIRERRVHPACKGAVCKYSRALEVR
jgi:MoaA/NifB/PqqE/SkfB family radical SAM enzyme